MDIHLNLLIRRRRLIKFPGIKSVTEQEVEAQFMNSTFLSGSIPFDLLSVLSSFDEGGSEKKRVLEKENTTPSLKVGMIKRE